MLAQQIDPTTGLSGNTSSDDAVEWPCVPAAARRRAAPPAQKPLISVVRAYAMASVVRHDTDAADEPLNQEPALCFAACRARRLGEVAELATLSAS